MCYTREKNKGKILREPQLRGHTYRLTENNVCIYENGQESQRKKVKKNSISCNAYSNDRDRDVI